MKKVVAAFFSVILVTFLLLIYTTPGQTLLGKLYQESGNDAKAVHWYRKAASLGNATAQTNLGGMYEKGKGVESDDKKAVHWYNKAASLGEATAQFKLALMYAKGKGVESDDKKAIHWYRKAAEQGHAKAQNLLGDRKSVV